MTISLYGVSASKGVAIGRVSLIERGQPETVEYPLSPAEVDPEVARFERAIADARREMQAMSAQFPPDTPTEVAEFMNVHLLMLDDAAITKVPVSIIRERRCNAEWALKLQRDAVMEVFEAMDEPYLRTRMDDVDHVVHQVQRMLAADHPSHDHDERRMSGSIVLAEDLTPADAVVLHNQGVAGLLTEYGGPMSHTAILARSLGIPAVVGLHHARAYVREGDTIIVDGREGTVLIEPEARITRHYEARRRDIARHRARRERLKNAPAVTRDGEQIGLQANVELSSDIDTARRVNADGIGLFRTETLYMNRRTPPGEDEQYAVYAEVVRAMRGAPVTIRTMDVGADKQVDGVRPGAPLSANPALGLRAIRLCLREPALFRSQLRAILRASALGPVRLLLPMLSNLQEVSQALQHIEACRAELAEHGQPSDPCLPIGAMIEVPAAALCAPEFARKLAFLSIGTNDLIQYTIAIDRVDDEVSYLYDPIHPAVLRLIQMTIRAGQRQGISVAMCGDMAADVRFTRLLLGMGLREFSVPPNALLEVKQVITESHVGELTRASRRILATTRLSTRLSLLESLNA